MFSWLIWFVVAVRTIRAVLSSFTISEPGPLQYIFSVVMSALHKVNGQLLSLPPHQIDNQPMFQRALAVLQQQQQVDDNAGTVSNTGDVSAAGRNVSNGNEQLVPLFLRDSLSDDDSKALVYNLCYVAYAIHTAAGILQQQSAEWITAANTRFGATILCALDWRNIMALWVADHHRHLSPFLTIPSNITREKWLEIIGKPQAIDAPVVVPEAVPGQAPGPEAGQKPRQG